MGTVASLLLSPEYGAFFMPETEQPWLVVHRDYSKASTAVMHDKNLSINARFLYIYLAGRGGKRGWFFPSGGIREISNDIGMSASTIKRCIRELSAAGVIETGRTNHYGAAKYIVKTEVNVTCVLDNRGQIEP